MKLTTITLMLLLMTGCASNTYLDNKEMYGSGLVDWCEDQRVQYQRNTVVKDRDDSIKSVGGTLRFVFVQAFTFKASRQTSALYDERETCYKTGRFFNNTYNGETNG